MCHCGVGDSEKIQRCAEDNGLLNVTRGGYYASLKCGGCWPVSLLKLMTSHIVRMRQ